MIRAPHTYAEWASVLTLLKDKTDDDAVLAAMQAGTIEWQTGVAERFSKKLIDAVNSRMNAASDKFQLDIQRAGGQERAIVQALLALRKEMRFLTRVLDIRAIPEQDRAQYVGLVRAQADAMQKSLEDSAKADRTGKLSSIIRNNRVNSL
ncbi:MAG: hypothetical protein IJH43_02505 [Mogibacterium sp.]|nr:hypothetical protein [Mogibacterium sp.]